MHPSRHDARRGLSQLTGFGQCRYDGRRHRRNVTTTESLTPKGQRRRMKSRCQLRPCRPALRLRVALKSSRVFVKSADLEELKVRPPCSPSTGLIVGAYRRPSVFLDCPDRGGTARVEAGAGVVTPAIPRPAADIEVRPLPASQYPAHL